MSAEATESDTFDTSTDGWVEVSGKGGDCVGFVVDSPCAIAIVKPDAFFTRPDRGRRRPADEGRETS